MQLPPNTAKTLAWLSMLLLITAVLSLSSGCFGVRTKQEVEAGQNLKNVEDRLLPLQPKLLPAQAALGAYLAAALQNSPAVRAAYYEWASAVHKISIERSFPDPRLTFSADIQEIISGLMPGLMMDFPGPGKLKGAATVARAESEASYFLFKQEVLRAAFEVKSACYNLRSLEQKIALSARLRDLMGEITELARSQAETGQVGLQDVLRSEIELELATTDLTVLHESADVLRARLKAALGLSRSDFEVPPRIELPDEKAAGHYDLSQALLSNPRVAQLHAEVRVAEAELALARRGRLPDVSIGLEADPWVAPVFFTPELSITLPIWKDKIASQIARAQARKSASEQRLSSEQIILAVELAEKTFLVKEAELVEHLFTTKVIPRAEQLLELLRVSYSTGRASFLDLREGQRGLARFHIEKINASASKQIALAELSLIVAGITPMTFPVLPAASAQNPVPSP